MPTFTKLPVSSFGPELMQLLQDGSRVRKTIELLRDGIAREIALRRATALVARLNSLRAAMRREKHQFADMVMRAKCRKDGTKVIVEPRDIEFADSIREAGVVPTKEADVAPPLDHPDYSPPEEGQPSTALSLEQEQPALEQKIEDFLGSISIKE